MSDAFSERMRLIRFRRQRERARFREELRVIPGWLVWTCAVLSIVAVVVGIGVNLYNLHNGGDVFPDDSFRGRPLFSCLALAGIILLASVTFSCLLFMLGYVYRDAKRRDMNPALWTLLVLILSPGYGVIGLIIYLLIREPLPYHCPQCSSTVSARFNFCPTCKYNLHPACPQCKREVSDADRFCPYCATELSPANASPAAANSTAIREPLGS